MNSIKCKVGLSDVALEYYEGYNLSRVVDELLETFDISVMPSVTRDITHRKTVNVYNVPFINDYLKYGARSEKVSLTRLVEYGYDADVLRLPQFKTPDLRRTKDVVTGDDTDYIALLEKAKKCLNSAKVLKRDRNIETIIHMINEEIENV